MQVRNLRDYINNPRYADHSLIQAFLQSILEHGLVFKERDIVDTGLLFKNYIEFLQGKIYYDAMKDLREKIILKCIFFPTIKEILDLQKDFLGFISRLHVILNQSLENFIETAQLDLIEAIEAEDKKKGLVYA